MEPSELSISPPPTYPPWSQLLPVLLSRVISHLPFPADRARFRAVCRAWHSTVRDHQGRQLPWLVLPDGSFCIAGDDDGNGGGVFFDRLPGLPPVGDAAMTCVVGSTDDWLVLDCTREEKHLKYLLGMICSKCSCCLLDKDDVKRKPSYLLQNAFSGATVPLPELDAVVSYVSRRFQIRKVLMRSSTPDDVIAVVTNSWDYNIILCRPGKGTHVLYYYDIFDVAFVGDWLYGITPNENLIGFRLAEDDEDGKPVVARTRRFITNPLPDGEEDYWSWIDEEQEDGDDEDDDGGHGANNCDDGNDNGDGNDGTVNDEDTEGDQEEEEHKVDDQAQNKEEEDSSGGEEEDNDEKEEEGEADDETQNTEEEEDCSSGDGMISNGVDVVQDEESLNEPKDYIITIRKLVKSRAGELLMVRQQLQAPSSEPPYSRKVEIFKADINAGQWLLVTGSSCLAEDEALFLSKSFSKSVRAHGDIRGRFIYFDDTLEAFDTTSSTCISFSLGDQVYRRLLSCRWLTWIFPHELEV